MDDSAPLMNADWIRYFQKLANAIQAPLTPGMIPDIPFGKIAMTLSPRLLGRTTAGAGSAEQISVSAPLTLAAGALGLDVPLLAIYGGTGFASYAVGNLLYADTTTTLAKLADVAVGSYLRSGGVGVAPLWSTATLPNTATTGDLLFASASNAYSNLADVSSGSYLRSGGVTTAPLWSTVKIPNTATTGDLWYASASNTVIARAIGSTNDVLTVAAGIPTWAPAASVATNVTITNDTTTNASMFPTWVTANTGNLPLKVTSTKLSFNPSTGLLSTTALTASGAVISDTPTLVVDATNHRVGIGTASPSTKLHVAGTANATQVTIRANATQSNTNPLLVFNKSDDSRLFDISSDSTFNIFIGKDSGANNVPGAAGGDNGTALTFNGYQSGQFNVSGRYLAGFGTHALNGNTTGRENVACGPNALLENETGNSNTAVGAFALMTFTAASNNTGVGFETQRTATGSYNCSIGMSSLKVASGNFNCSFGYNNMSATTSGHSNVSIGLTGLAGLTTGFGNVALGHYAGYGDVSDIANQHSVVDTYAVFAGFQSSRDASIASSTVLTNIIAIGKNARVSTSNTMILGGTSGDAVNVGIGMITASARLHLPAGTATAGTAPLLLTSGTSLTTAVAGAIEFTTDDFFATITTGAARKAFVLDDGTRLTSGKVPVATTNGRLIDGPTLTTVLVVRASGRSTAQTAAVASVATFTLTAADASFRIGCNVNITTSTSFNFSVQVTYTDETNTSRTLTLNVSQLAGTLVTAITDVTGAGPYEGVPVDIRCKASTAITVKTAGTFTTVTYNVEGSITQLT